MGNVKRAYGLNDHDTESLMKALWPHGLFPLELWQKVYEKFWRGFADRNEALYRIKAPVFPESAPEKEEYFFSHVYAHDMTLLFSHLAIKIHANAIRLGLKDLLEVAYEDVSDVLVQERIDYLLHKLTKIEDISTYKFPAIDYDGFVSLVNEKVVGISANSYGFISTLFVDTIVVDKIAAIHYLSVVKNYPLKQEIKGITQRLVDAVVRAASQEAPIVLQINSDPLPSPMEVQATSHEQHPSILIPRALWEGKKPQQVCADMRIAGHTNDAPIAHALHYWVGIKNMTEIGTILRGEDISDSARHKYARKKLKEAEGRYRSE